MGIKDPDTPDEEFLRQFMDGITRDIENRYQVPLPWKDKSKLPSNKSIAMKRLESQLRQLSKDENKRHQYHVEILELLKSGYIRKANPDHEGPYTFVPHR